MPAGRRRRGLPGFAPALLIGVAVLALLLDTSSLPHVHAGVESALYSRECGLSYLATFGGIALLPANACPGPCAVVVAVAVSVGPSSPASAPLRHTDSRGPPPA